MQKKSIIAILGAVMMTIIASIAIVLTVAPHVHAAEDGVVLVPAEYLYIDEDYCCRGFTSEGKSYIQNLSRYRIEIPYGVKGIGYRASGAFQNCAGLVSVHLPDSVTGIGIYAFQNCSNLTSINIPDSVTGFGSFTFSGCGSLTSIDLPKSGKSISDYTFSGCRSLTSIKIPDSVTKIGRGSFSDCSGLTKIEISVNVTSIDVEAFKNCSSLIAIEIPEGVTSIDANVFNGCDKLEDIVVGNQALMSDSNLQVYADKLHWKGEEHMVAFNVMGGSTVAAQGHIKYRDLATKPENPTKSGYAFVGWYLNGEAYDFSTPVRNDIVLTAQWVELATVTFDVNGGSAVASQTIIKGATVAKPEDPTREGYKFLGWYNGEEAYDFTSAVNDDLTLTAKWEAIPVQPEDPTNPEQSVDNSTEESKKNNGAVVAAVAGTCAVVGLGGIGAVIAVVLKRRKSK